MKKIKFVLVFIVFLPIFINASCNYDKLNEHTKLSNDIDYELFYSLKTNQFDVKFINVIMVYILVITIKYIRVILIMRLLLVV